MGGKSSKQKSKKNKMEEGANGETEGQKDEQAQEQQTEGDVPAEKKLEENGTVKKESDNQEEGDRIEETKDLSQTIPVTEPVALTSEAASPTECAPATTQPPPSEPAPPVAAEEVHAEGNKENVTEQTVEKVLEQSAPENTAAPNEVSETVLQEPQKVLAETTGEAKVEAQAETVVLEKTEEPVEPAAAAEELVQPDSVAAPEESAPLPAPEETEEPAPPALPESAPPTVPVEPSEALLPQDLPPPPPVPTDSEDVDSTQQEQVPVAEERDSTAAAPSDTAESGAAASDALDTTEAAAPSEEPVPSTVVTEFRWEGTGETVLVSGTFNHWQEKIPLAKNGDIFTKTLDLPIGEYLYKFFVDEQWMVNKAMPIKCDENGEENNVVVVELAS
ncbi:cell surface glycoprotein 1-like [Biomphalaria glabrata]|uniref:5'-AMP-activated protein kinase subunit beta-1 n=1 Tax=Biomphalaria glabrata TaxID=6526 RepID=A0A9U8DZ74_BIOGL|nr:cell surface glycoprotein 1-like [Biomphalaria glabrata]XP_013067143.2 cell surface glycoprotein 1-like [Biomphalaria glabrata]XP_013067144.2 cell surface glycoprotein 1-like [Biomphalaria glabrata]XP_013067145.2 cell surface glycoprotein 1-like [Biomphalaria glabrata]KAI8787927.1 cell surface glycoprotein 1 [Biomphalaria glabrata]